MSIKPCQCIREGKECHIQTHPCGICKKDIYFDLTSEEPIHQSYFGESTNKHSYMEFQRQDGTTVSLSVYKYKDLARCTNCEMGYFHKQCILKIFDQLNNLGPVACLNCKQVFQHASASSESYPRAPIPFNPGPKDVVELYRAQLSEIMSGEITADIHFAKQAAFEIYNNHLDLHQASSLKEFTDDQVLAFLKDPNLTRLSYLMIYDITFIANFCFYTIFGEDVNTLEEFVALKRNSEIMYSLRDWNLPYNVNFNCCDQECLFSGIHLKNELKSSGTLLMQKILRLKLLAYVTVTCNRIIVDSNQPPK